MANTFLTPSVFANEGLHQLENELILGNKIHTDHSKDFAMVGDTLNIRRPTSYLGQEDNLDVSSYSEDITQGKTTIVMDKTLSIKMDVGAIDGTLSFDRVQEDIIRPAVIKMRDYVETSIAALYSQLYWFTGTAGTVPSTFKSLAQGGAIMTDAAIPNADRFAVHGTADRECYDMARASWRTFGSAELFTRQWPRFTPSHGARVAFHGPVSNRCE